MASDVPAILKYTRNVYYIGNLEFAKLTPGEAHFYDLNGDEIEKQTTEIKWDYGGEIPLSSIATVEMGESATAINRENQKNYITISASADGMSGGEAQKLVDQILAGYTFPDGCTYGYSGTLEMMNDAFSSLLTALVVAVLLVYMIMASQFESIRYPMIIMVSMPLAFTGAILGLFLTGNTITMTSMMGFIMLAGMVVNNGIVLIDYTNQLMDRGMRCYDALTTAGPRRLRPILISGR